MIADEITVPDGAFERAIRSAQPSVAALAMALAVKLINDPHGADWIKEFHTVLGAPYRFSGASDTPEDFREELRVGRAVREFMRG